MLRAAEEPSRSPHVLLDKPESKQCLRRPSSPLYSAHRMLFKKKRCTANALLAYLINCHSFVCTLLTQEDAVQHMDIRLDWRSVHRKPTFAVFFLIRITVFVQLLQCKHITWIILHTHMQNIKPLGNQNRALIFSHAYELPWSIADKILRFSSVAVSKVLHERMCETNTRI